MPTNPRETSQNKQYEELLNKNVPEIQKYLDEHPDEEGAVKREENAGQKRAGVLTYQPNSGDGDENDNSGDGDGGSESDDSGTPDDEMPEGQKTATSGVTPKKGYNPYHDPDVPSSAVAENIAIELRTKGGSVTLAAVQAAAKAKK